MSWPATAYLDASRAPRTRREYAKYWRAWERWCSLQDVSALPALPDTVATYVVDRADTGDRVATIRSRLATITSWHREHGHDSPCSHENIRRLLRGIARSQADETPAQVAGLTAEKMEAIEAAVNPRVRLHREGLALCWVMRDAMLRRSEAAALRWEDVERDRDGTGRVMIRRSKTDQLGVGAIQFLSTRAVRALWMIRPTAATGRVFPLHPNSISSRIALLARRAGLPGRFRGHSPRIGMSVDLVESGASLVELQQAGRWASPTMPAKYARSVVAARGAVAKFYQQPVERGARRGVVGRQPWLERESA